MATIEAVALRKKKNCELSWCGVGLVYVRSPRGEWPCLEIWPVQEWEDVSGLALFSVELVPGTNIAKAAFFAADGIAMPGHKLHVNHTSRDGHGHFSKSGYNGTLNDRYREEDWPELRDRCFARDDFTCRGECGRHISVLSPLGLWLEAHHTSYRTLNRGGDVELADLETRCTECHAKEHGRGKGDGNGEWFTQPPRW